MSIPVPNEREATQQEDGSFRCNQCRGDWYACECPRETSKPKELPPLFWDEDPFNPWRPTPN